MIIKKEDIIKRRKKDLKSLLDVCTAFGVSFADSFARRVTQRRNELVVNAPMGTTFDHAR